MRMDKTVLFYWSKGAPTRVQILLRAFKCRQKKEPCFLSQIAESIGLSHVGAKKHVGLLVEERYLKEINPDGKPVFLELTEKGEKIVLEFKNKKWNGN